MAEADLMEPYSDREKALIEHAARPWRESVGKRVLRIEKLEAEIATLKREVKALKGERDVLWKDVLRAFDPPLATDIGIGDAIGSRLASLTHERDEARELEADATACGATEES